MSVVKYICRIALGVMAISTLTAKVEDEGAADQAARVLVWDAEDNPLTGIVKQILEASATFRKCCDAKKLKDESPEDCYRKYLEKVQEFLTESFKSDIQKFTEMAAANPVTKVPAKDFKEKEMKFWHFNTDPVFGSRRLPDVLVISSEGSYRPDRDILLVSELIFNKEKNGYDQRESKIIFMHLGDKWLVDDVEYRDREYDQDRWWDGFSVREMLHMRVGPYPDKHERRSINAACK